MDEKKEKKKGKRLSLLDLREESLSSKGKNCLTLPSFFGKATKTSIHRELRKKKKVGEKRPTTIPRRGEEVRRIPLFLQPRRKR